MSVDLPKVSVLMSVYNGEKYIEKAIESILNQTFRDYELIIINDGSTDSTSTILSRYEKAEDRISVYHQANQGVGASRNRGCQIAQGKYIAVMDSDDISLPERLAKEIHYMEAHPEISVLGTWVECIDKDDKQVSVWQYPTAPGVIGWCLFFTDCLAHSSVMMRRDFIEQLGFYRPEFAQAEDYDLWARASFVSRIANLPEILVRYRSWEGGLTSRYQQTVEQFSAQVTYSMITQLLGQEVSEEAIFTLRHMYPNPSLPPLTRLQQIGEAVTLLQRLYQTYLRTNFLDHREAKEVAHDAGTRMYTLALAARQFSWQKGFAILIQALRLNPRLLPMLSAQLAKKSVRTLLGRA